MTAVTRQTEDRDLETYSLVWLDDSINNSKENLQAQQILRTSSDHLLIFEDHHLCLQHLRSLQPDNRVIFILSHQIGLTIIPQIAELIQIISIYIYSSDQNIDEHWIQNFSQIKGITNRFDELIHRIQREIRKFDEILPIHICNSKSLDEGQSSTELNGQFIHSQLLIDCLIRMKPSTKSKDEFISLCKELYKTNPTELNRVKEFECEYLPKRSLWWYTRHSFIFRLLNRSLRTQNIELLYLFRFYIRDMEEELKMNQCLLPVQVYRAQLMSKDEIEVLKKSIGDFISINSFLSTSLDRKLASFYLTDSTNSSDNLERVFLEIDADPKLENIKPFSHIASLSCFPNEQEVLFMIGSIFRLTHVKYNSNGIWNIRMVLCSENDHQLRTLFYHMKNEINHDQADLMQLGHILRIMGKLNDAEIYFQRYFNQLSIDHSDIYPCCHALGMITDAKGDYDTSLKWYDRSLEIAMKIMGSDHSDIAAIHNSIAMIYDNKGDYTRALGSYEKALKIWKATDGDDHRKVATCLNNMGVAYQGEKKYALALEFYQKAFNIWMKHMPNDHYILGMSHNNIGEAYTDLGRYDLALEQYNLSLKIKLKSLPSQHSDIAMTYENIGKVYENKNDFQQALTYFEKAAKIYRYSFPATHSTVLKIEQIIKQISSKFHEL